MAPTLASALTSFCHSRAIGLATCGWLRQVLDLRDCRAHVPMANPPFRSRSEVSAVPSVVTGHGQSARPTTQAQRRGGQGPAECARRPEHEPKLMTLSCLPGEGINLLLMKLRPSYTKTIRTVSKWRSDVYTSICQGAPYGHREVIAAIGNSRWLRGSSGPQHRCGGPATTCLGYPAPPVHPTGSRAYGKSESPLPHDARSPATLAVENPYAVSQTHRHLS